MERNETKGKRLLFQAVCGLFLLPPIPGFADDLGGLTARFSSGEVSPGDLFVLTVEMHRPDYGEFALEVPSHPRLHLVTRDPIPPRLSSGRYHQEERLVLQALSSGPLTLSGIRARLTESGGTRVVALPDLSLNVLPFQKADELDAPQPFPQKESETVSRSRLIAFFSLLLMAALPLLYFLRRMRSRAKPSEASQASRNRIPEKITTRDFEALLEKRGDALSSELRADLDTFLYAPKHSGIDPADLKARLRKELEG